MGDLWQQNVVLENRPGAGATIGTDGIGVSRISSTRSEVAWQPPQLHLASTRAVVGATSRSASMHARPSWPDGSWRNSKRASAAAPGLYDFEALLDINTSFNSSRKRAINLSIALLSAA